MKLSILLLLTLLFSSVLPGICIQTRDSCSTFVLQQGEEFIVGHNVDMPMAIPGMIVINKRNVQKKGISWQQLTSAKKIESPEISWTSRYGSVTFNPQGRDFPDGGMNEAGLTINETSLRETKHLQDKLLPKLFTMMWIQYALDNFETVEQVIESVSRITLDGGQWDFFITDRYGKMAIIEFLEGKAVVRTGKNLPVPVQTNTLYVKEIKNLETYEGFGGNKTILMKEKKISRFVQAAKMLKDYNSSESTSIIDYGFAILKRMDRGYTRWSIVFDVRNMCFYFRTFLAKKVKYFFFSSFDFSSRSPVKICDLNVDLSGDVTGHFSDYSYEVNRKMVQKCFDTLYKQNRESINKALAAKGITLKILVDRITGYPGTTTIKKKGWP